MADKPTTSRVGRPRSRSASQTPKGTARVDRPRSKSAQKPKVKGSRKKAVAPTKRAVRPILQFEWDVVKINPRQFGDQLPDLLPLDIEQDNIPLNPPNQPQTLPAGEDNNQQHQVEKPNLPPESEELEQPNLPPIQPNQPNQPPNQVKNLQVAMVHAQQLNWSYFKTEFSGKPEDTEEHLLRTNDWMETHNFPDDQKVRRFCLTLTGEARLWCETLGTVQLDWHALRDCFYQQYSEFGSTREQYFLAWRSFQFDENGDTIDSYVHKVKQVATLLNYGEPQILELFKNTLPSRLYYMVYNINNLREPVETAEHMLTKEQIDGHKSGQAASSPFMKANLQNSKKKGVTFNDMETIQKQEDSVDKPISLLNELSGKLDRKDNSSQYKPRIHSGRNRGCRQRQNRYSSRKRSYSRDRGPYNNRGRNRRNYQNQNHYGLGSNKNRDRDYQNNRSNYRRKNSNQNYGQRFRHRSISRECDRSQPRYRSTSRENLENRYRTKQSRSRERQISRTTSRERDTRSRSRSSPQVSTNRDRSRCYRCNEYDHFARECPNIMSNEEQIENLQMLLPEEQTEVLNTLIQMI